jgi:hypothetical protein
MVPATLPPVPIRWEVRWAPGPVWTRRRREKNSFTAPAEKWTPAVQPVCYSLNGFSMTIITAQMLSA